MISTNKSSNACCCSSKAPPVVESVTSSPMAVESAASGQVLIAGTKKTAKALPPFFVSLLFAFFPKCPVCWAVYMSMFGSLGLARLPYMGWLFPVLILLLAFHLFMIYRKIPRKGYTPFWLSFAGATVLLCGRTFFPTQKWLLLTGMALIIAGSLFNSFSRDRLSLIVSKANHQ